MASFNYKVVDKKNKIISGTMKSASKRRIRKKLEKDGSTVLFIVPEKNSAFSLRSLPFLSRFSTAERINFFRNLAAMVVAGVTVSDSLRVLKEQMPNKQAKKAVSEMIGDIENGQKLSIAMKKAPKKYFSEFLIEAVNVGEVAGKLTDTLDRISDDLQYEYDLRRKVKASMTYPGIVVFVMLIVATIMMVYVLPQIASLFTELEVNLPLPTRILLWTSNFIQSYYYFIIAFIILFIVVFVLLLKNVKTRYYIHYAYLKMPIFGKLIKETNLSLFFRSLEALFAAGISLLRSIEVSEKTLKNEVYRKTLTAMNPILIHGTNLSEVMKPFPFLFPLQLQRMVEVGEKTGKLEESFKRLCGYYDRSVKHRTDTLTATIEPLIMIIAGIGVGIIALSIFMPIYGATQAL